jgi:hypothetical protein
LQERCTESLQRQPVGVGRLSMRNGPPAWGDGAHSDSACGGAGSAADGMAAAGAATNILLFLFCKSVFRAVESITPPLKTAFAGPNVPPAPANSYF